AMQGEMVAVLICLGRGTENLRQPVWLILECDRHLRWFGVNVRNCWLPLESRWSGKRRRAKRLQPSKSVLYHLAHLCLESMSSDLLRQCAQSFKHRKRHVLCSLASVPGRPDTRGASVLARAGADEFACAFQQHVRNPIEWLAESDPAWVRVVQIKV